MRLEAAHRQRHTRGPCGVLLIAALAGLLGVARVGAPAPSGELHVGVPRVPASLDPASATTSAELLALRLLYQGLVTFGDRGDIEPALATTWSVSRDGLIWTFRLRSDVQLHDDTPLGIDDVVTALAGRISADEPLPGVPLWIRPFRGGNRLVREIRRAEGGSVQIILGQPFAPLLALLAHPALGVGIPRGADGRVGSGPYRAVELTADRLVLEAASQWRGESPQSARLVLHAVAD